MSNTNEVIVPEVVEPHSKFGPSKYTPWSGCILWEGIDDGDASELALRGTYSHSITQSIIEKDPNLVKPRPACAEDDDEEAGEWGAQAIISLADGRKIHSESKIFFSDELAKEIPELKGAYGTVDAWFSDEFGQLHVCDFKTFDRGEKDHTPQMSGYAFFICSQYEEFIDKPIYLHVIAGGIRKVITYQTDFATASRLVMDLVARRLDPNQKPTPCDSCQYCAKSGRCEAAAQIVSLVTDKPVSWDTMHLADKKVIAGVLTKLLKAFDDEFKRAMDKNGGVVENVKTGVRWVRTYKNPSRKVVSMVGLSEGMKKHGVSESKFIEEVCSATQTGVKSALKKAGMKGTEIEDFVNQHFVAPVGAVGSAEYKREK